jgi:di/tripeptidase
VHDARKNFTAIEFKQLAFFMSIKVKEVPVKAYNSVGLVERYHAPLRQAYEIIKKELKNKHINKEMILQMTVKAVNDSAGPDRIVLILLVFGLYPRITKIDPPSPTIAKRAEAIRAVTKEVRRLHTKRQVSDALTMRNSLNTMATGELPL